MTGDPFGTVPVAALVVIALVAVVLAGAVAAVESSLARLSHAAVEDLVEEDRHHSRELLALVDQRARANLSLRGTRTLLQVVVAVSTTLALVHPDLPWWAIALIAVAVVGIAQFLAVSVVALRLSTRDPEGIALWGARMATRLVRASHLSDPLIRLVRSRLPQPTQTEAEARQEMADDLREMVDQVGETEGFEDEDREMLRSVFELGHTMVREVMVPRTDMVTVDADLTARKALRLFVRSGFSRIPVIGDDVDDVRGILFFKDVVQRLETRGTEPELSAEQMMRPAEFTVETKPADDLLRQMQEEHFHMALVVDEYGGISGLVTLEDVIEELVGELTDEHDRNVVEPEEVSPGVWRVPSRFPLGELGELLGLEVDDEDVDSVGGLLGKAIGRVPLPGAQGDLLGVHMEAEGARGRRRQVGTVLCSRSPEPGASGPGGSGGDKDTAGSTAGDRHPTTSDHAPGQE
ncbi:hemolysin family protein [Actinomyces polynesiensis]|uniref:hemolysin family protein n=1 Tax=Actinomyces polynesiensis TaxID=1325934 RepID=UPI000938F28E|nr:hemolysin family protein [Actinomyces polynesiensis]